MKRFVLSLFAIILCGCQTNESINVIFDTKNVEYMSSKCSLDLIKTIDGNSVKREEGEDAINYNGKPITCSELDTSFLGEQRVICNYSQKLYETTVLVVDTKKPEINIDDVIEITEKDVDLKSFIEVKDENNIKNVEVIGKIDYKHNGEYEASIMAEDESGNVAIKQVTVVVKIDGNKKKPIETKPQPEEKPIQTPNAPIQKPIEPTTPPEPTTPQEPVRPAEPEKPVVPVTPPQSSCQAGTYHVEATTVDEAGQKVMEKYHCTGIWGGSDGTQYGWDITCDCQ